MDEGALGLLGQILDYIAQNAKNVLKTTFAPFRESFIDFSLNGFVRFERNVVETRQMN